MTIRTARCATFIAAVVIGIALALTSAGPATASPTVPHNPQAPAGIGAGAVIVIRPHRADLVRGGVVVRVVPLPSGTVGLDTVIRAIGDPRWASVSGSTATLYAAILQRPGTDLRIAAPLRTVLLTDSAVSPAYLSGSSSTVEFDDVTVSSSKTSGGTAVESAHRPYVRYTDAVVTATASTFAALGSRVTPGHGGFTIGSGGTLTASNATFKNSGIGLEIDGAKQVTLTGVTATGNGRAGISLARTGSADLSSITATGNATGLVIRGPAGPPRMQKVVLSHNAIGLDAGGLTGAQAGIAAELGPVSTDHNSVAGIEFSSCPGCVIDGLTSTADTVGIRLEKLSTDVVMQDSVISATGIGVDIAASRTTIDGVRMNDGQQATGVRVGRAAIGVQIVGGSVSGGSVGVAVDGADASINGTRVTGASVGVQIGADGNRASVIDVIATGSSTALAIDRDAGTVTVSRFTASQDGGTGIRSGAAHVTIDGATVTGAGVGLDLSGHTTITGGSVTGAAEAVRVGKNGRAQFTGTELQAHVLGLRIADSARVTLIRSRVRAPLGARGRVNIGPGTSFPALPLRWLGVLALVALAFAALLEALRRLRERSHDRSVTAPPHVLNIA